MTTAQIARLRKQARDLDGRPVPGVRMSEDQFEAWLDEDVRAEWVDGEVIMMAPTSSEHVNFNFWLGTLLRMYVEDHDLGFVWGIDSQVRLAAIKRRRNPDLLFVSKARGRIIKKTYVDGPPDLIVEIVSPDSQSRDWRDKYLDYGAAGVREYWVVDLQSRRFDAYALGRTKKYVRIDEREGKVVSKVLRGFYLRPEWLWKSPLPKVATVLKELGVG